MVSRELISPICGQPMHHCVSCPMLGELVCDKCHSECWMLNKSISLWHCMYHQIVKEGGLVCYGKK